MSLSIEKPELGDRRTYIGGSDIGAIMGRSRYRTPVDVYYQKIGETPEFKGNEATFWGNILEAVVAAEYARREGVKVVRDRNLYRHPDYPYMVGHIDRRVLNAPGGKVLEVKTAGKWFKPADWEDEPPPDYVLQVQWYMGLTGWQNADLVALLAGQDFRTYSIPRDEFVIQEAFETAKEFWARVQERNPPPPRNEEDCKKLWSLDNAQTVIATEVEEAWAIALREVQAQIKALEDKETELKVKLMDFMRPRAFLVDIAGNKLASWKNDSELEADRLIAEHPEEVAAYLVQKLNVTELKKDKALAKLAKDYTRQSEKRVFRLAAAPKAKE